MTMEVSFLLFLLHFLVNVTDSGATLVVRHVRDTETVIDLNGGESDRPFISVMHIESKVKARYGEVVVTTHVENVEAEDKETTFFFYLPLSAFISKFTMRINDETYTGAVMEKGEAKKTYEEAKEKNQTAGHVEQETEIPTKRPDMDMFTVSVNLAANGSAVFELRYQELIERRNRIYKQVINVKPNQVVPDFQIKCSYHEPQDFEMFSFTLPKSKNAIDLPREDAELHASPSRRILMYTPNEEIQSSFDPLNGIGGDFVVSYDVKHTDEGGLVVFTEEGYIVSYYSPSVPDSDILPKDIVFITDISGSMGGEKIKQARNSLIEIIDKLRSVDRFNIILFDDKVELYAKGFVQVTEQNKRSAKAYAEKNVIADGGTNINEAIRIGLGLFESRDWHDPRGNIIVFLTDGQPTVGTTNTGVIRSNVRRENYYKDESGKTLLKAVMYCLGFGFNMNFDFLTNLAEENGGNARRIYERLDAKDQLVYFFDELSDPYLSQVSFSICQSTPQGPVTKLILNEDKISRNEFPYYFSGSEIIVVAQLPEIPVGEWRVCMSGDGASGTVDTMITPVKDDSISLDPSFIENLYAYKQIKHYLVMVGKALNEFVAVKYTELALNMSLRYQFVTPLTSMVVTYAMKEKRPLSRERVMDMASGGAPFLKISNTVQSSLPASGSQRNAWLVFSFTTAMTLFWIL